MDFPLRKLFHSHNQMLFETKQMGRGSYSDSVRCNGFMAVNDVNGMAV